MRYKDKKIYKDCPICGKSFLKTSIKGHLITHEQDKKFQCKECGAEFRHQPSLDRHSVQIHGIDKGKPGSYTKTYKYGKKECTICCIKVSSLSSHNFSR